MALLISPFSVILTWPDPPFIEPYIVKIKKNDEATTSAIND